ncbi:MAG: hypothetical protein IJT72_08770 [Lachnospiraceae bacterium]|nr:hypothetical protein [Lachnospiraceae bacterium]
MLGKCIKNEIINRYKPLLLVYSVLLIYSPIYYILDQMRDNMNNDYVMMFVGLLQVVYGFVVLFALLAVFFYPLYDFRNRLFKDQGYLTNTLPVKTSTLMIGRLIVDILTYISAAIVIPFSICLAAMDFRIYGKLFDLVIELIGYITTDVSNVLVLTMIILVLLTFLAGMLLSQWMFNAAYAFGHSFSNNKKVMSIIGMLIFYAAFQVLSIFFLVILKNTGLLTDFQEIENASNYSFEVANTFFGVICIFEMLGVAALVAITGWLTKHKLNLE